jgi:hypothetical protein
MSDRLYAGHCRREACDTITGSVCGGPQAPRSKNIEMASPIETNATAIHVPRLPIPGPRAFGAHAPVPVPSVVDGRRYLLTTSGRAAILLALRALGVGAGDRVLVPTYHCPTMIAPVVHLRALPVYYPIDEDGLPRLDGLAAGGRTKAMLAAHWFGLPLRLDAAASWCRARDIALVEDCAHAFFGSAADRAVGSAGDLCVASLTKFFPVPEGGCITGRPDLLAGIVLTPASFSVQVRNALDVVEAAARYRRLGPASGVARALFALKARLRRAGAAAPAMPAAGGASEACDPAEYLDEATCLRQPAWIARTIFTHADRTGSIAARRRNYRRLAELLAEVRGARPLRPILADGAVPYVFPLDVDRPESAYHAIRLAGVPVFRWDRLWAGTPMLPGDAGTRWSRHVLQLGCHQDIGEPDLLSMVRIVREHVEREG